MGGKVNLYLDDESLDRWYSLPRGFRSQIVREALLSQKVEDPEGREKLLIQEKRRRLDQVEKEITELRKVKSKLTFELRKLESSTTTDEIDVPKGTEISERFQRANLFWRQMINRAPLDAEFVRTFKPSKIMTMGRRTEHSALKMYFVIRKDHVRVELYIYAGKNSVPDTLRLYDYLKQNREQIESDFGRPLSWQETSRTARRIIHRIDGIDIWDDTTWPHAMEQMTESMEELWGVLHPHISYLSNEE